MAGEPAYQDHYVPRALIKEWVPGETLDLANGKWRPTVPRSTFVASETYTVQLHGEADRTLDSVFDGEWNSFCAWARSELKAGEALKPQARRSVLRWIASQWARTPSAGYFVDMLVASAITPELIEEAIGASVGTLDPVPEAVAVIRDSEILAHLIARPLSTRRRDQVQQFYRMLKVIDSWAIHLDRAENGMHFVLSDHPVVLAEMGPNSERQHRPYALRDLDEVMVPLTPAVLLRLTRTSTKPAAPSAEWFNAAAVRQAYEGIVARHRTDLPAEVGVVSGIRSIRTRVAKPFRLTNSSNPNAIPAIPDKTPGDFVTKTLRHEENISRDLVREAVSRVVSNGLPDR